MDTGNVISLLSLCVAALACFASLRRNGSIDERSAEARRQHVDDKLDHISATCSETRDTVRELNRKLDDHSTRLATLEAQAQTLFKRIERVESRCDARVRPEGTD